MRIVLWLQKRNKWPGALAKVLAEVFDFSPY